MKWVLALVMTSIGHLYSQQLVDVKTEARSELGSFTSDRSRTINSYRYVKASSHGIYPGIGLGYRQHGKHGFNMDFSVYKYERNAHSLYGKGHYLFYPKIDHFYLGCGAGCVGAYIGIFSPPTEYIVLPTLEGMVGYEWKSEGFSTFLQLEASAIFTEYRVHYRILPLPSLSFGIGF